MASITDHPQRYQLVNELHARPFPSMGAPSSVAFLAIKPDQDAASRDRAADLAHLTALLDRHGAPHPQPGATHYFGEIGRYHLKWESHTEFVTYTAYTEGLGARAFDKDDFAVFPADWLAAAPGTRITSALIRVAPMVDDAQTRAGIDDWFVSESVAVARVLDNAAVIAGDFRIDPAGHQRFCVTVAPGTGPRRVGRIVTRLCEIETYKTLSMLGFLRVQEMGPRIGLIDQRLSRMIGDMSGGLAKSEETLQELLDISGELEGMVARASFRFGATAAYEEIVCQRIEVLQERRFEGLQTFAEFMMRRFRPAMRTVTSTQQRLADMADRARRAGSLLRTRVDVERSAQNQALLASMDRRADQQLRLQKTVEGLSVVAISYYAVSLAGYLLYPLAGMLGISKGLLISAVTPPILLGVWWIIRRIRNAVH